MRDLESNKLGGTGVENFWQVTSRHLRMAFGVSGTSESTYFLIFVLMVIMQLGLKPGIHFTLICLKPSMMKFSLNTNTVLI